jgi:hypothetical protein
VQLASVRRGDALEQQLGHFRLAVKLALGVSQVSLRLNLFVFERQYK